MKMNQVYLGLGTNLGRRWHNLERAIEGLRAQVTITSLSSVYETKPFGVEDQPDFLNMCLAGQTVLKPLALLDFVKALEIRLGRTSSRRWGPRLIDIDILFYDDLVLNVPRLQIPHAGAAERSTVLVPLAEIAPALHHPVMKKTIQDLLDGLEPDGVILAGQLPHSS